jgi:hypothetical protein
LWKERQRKSCSSTRCSLSSRTSSIRCAGFRRLCSKAQPTTGRN